MNTRIALLLFTAVIFILSGCRKEKKTDKETYREILSSRTLGLAYLEENKLNEAEAEFLKLIELDPEQSMGYANLGLVYLRMGKYEESVKQLQKAISLDPKNPDIHLILAKVYEVNDHQEKSLEQLKNILQFAPDHVKTLYSLAEFYGKSGDRESLDLREKYLSDVVRLAPDNIVPRLNLVEILLRNGEPEKALDQLEAIHQQFPEFPDEARAFFNKTLEALHTGKTEDALTSARIFHNFLKLSSPYQAGVTDLKGPGGELIGFPVITVGNAVSTYASESESILDALRFNDVTSTVGLNLKQGTENPIGNKNTVRLLISDFDGDGDLDVYAGSYLKQSGKSEFLFLNNMGSFSEVSDNAGFKQTGKSGASAFADYDNDGFLDLYITRDGGNYLYHNNGDGTFSEVAGDAGIDEQSAENVAKFVDLDHDGDLDLFLGGTGRNKVFRNNSDGSFSEMAEQIGLAGDDLNTQDMDFGDFDDDGDIDVVIVNNNGPGKLFTNLRQGRFEDITAKCGLGELGNKSAVAVGDFNNDGYLDLFFLDGEKGQHTLFENNPEGIFKQSGQTENIRKMLGTAEGKAAKFVDFDNDGHLDLLVAVIPEKHDDRSLYLFHNDGWGKFEDVSGLLPAGLKDVTGVEVADFNEDGDMDIFLACMDGTIHLLRNDGGNANHYLKVKLVGLRAGSSKNNHYGIGSKLEVRSGDLYQMKVVTDPVVHFGLGNRSRADVVRILWTNGVPQNIFTPGSDQDLIEQQELKGSCPFLYTWNGENFEFVKDFMWRSALGMPLGIMGGTTKYAFPDASREYLKIPGELLKEKNGKYIIQVTSELWETIYFDQLRLIAVDHPVSYDIYTDEKFIPPPYPGLRLYAIKGKHLPVKAVDENGIDVLPEIAEKDDHYTKNIKHERYQGITEMKELNLDLGDFKSDKDLFLFLQGWIFPTDASINRAISQSNDIVVVPPYLQVLNEDCQWETVNDNIGFPMGKDKTVVVDLSGIFPTKDHKIRILTNMEIYWDHIFYGHEDLNGQAMIREISIQPESADLHYRGFSKMYRKGGPYGPHWFDYSNVSTGQKWRDLTGNYTRYGDVTPLLSEADDKYIIYNAGDEITVIFNAGNLPGLARGWKRDFVIYSEGWVKDGDLNTATGNKVEPLPFHEMKVYPYLNGEEYPRDTDHQDYRRDYNTRAVTTEEFRHALSDKK